jgi:hypothetical protein
MTDMFIYLMYRICDTMGVGNMGWQCYGQSCEPSRGFLTQKEKIEMLEEYKKNLELEAKGVAERIKELSANKE